MKRGGVAKFPFSGYPKGHILQDPPAETLVAFPSVRGEFASVENGKEMIPTSLFQLAGDLPYLYFTSSGKQSKFFFPNLSCGLSLSLSLTPSGSSSVQHTKGHFLAGDGMQLQR